MTTVMDIKKQKYTKNVLKQHKTSKRTCFYISMYLTWKTAIISRTLFKASLCTWLSGCDYL